MWVKKRHKITFFLLVPWLRLFCYLRYNYRGIKCKEKGPFLILCNHTATLDFFLVAMSFKDTIYYLTSDDLMSKGFVSKVIKFLVEPIPKSKSLRDVEAVKGCLKVAKENGTICIFPEGNRTYSGKLCYVDPSIVKLCRKLNYKVAIYNVEGGYQTDPRFSNKVRRGKMRGYVKKILTPTMMENMTNDEIYAELVENLNVDLVNNVKFKSNKKAEYLERAIYYCGECNTFEQMHSEGNKFICKNCNSTFIVDDSANLVKGDEIYPISELYDLQSNVISNFSMEQVDLHKYQDEVSFFEVIKFKGRNTLFEGTMELKNNTLCFGQHQFSFDDIENMTVLGKNKINFYLNRQIFQVKGNKRFSGLKYLQIYNHYKNLKRGIVYDGNEFLGL